MRIRSLVILLIGLMMISPSLVYAQSADVNPGITPDSPFYGIDVAWDNLRYLIAIGDEAKVNEGLRIAEERLAEIEASNSSVSVEMANTQREDILERVRNKASEMNDSEVQNTVQLVLQHHTQVLESLRDDVPSEALDGLNTAIEESKKQRQSFRDIISEKTNNPPSGS